MLTEFRTNGTRRAAGRVRISARALAPGLLLLAGFCAACSSPPVVVKSLPSAVVSRKPELLDPALLDETIGGRDGEAYRVGPGDTILVAVYGHPELSIGSYGGSGVVGQANRLAGLVIDNDGTIQFPLIGSVLYWITATIIALFTGWLPALIFAIVYLIYMQLEAYVLTPRVMNKAISVPGALVVIGAMVGGTLLGLLGALVAIPVTASILLIIKQVFIPRQDAKR